MSMPITPANQAEKECIYEDTSVSAPTVDDENVIRELELELAKQRQEEHTNRFELCVREDRSEQWSFQHITPYLINATCMYPTLENFIEDKQTMHDPTAKILYRPFIQIESQNNDSSTISTASMNCNESNIYEDLPYQIVDANGKTIHFDSDSGTLPCFLLHKLRQDDTLASLAIAYGVLEEDIKIANMILTELAYYSNPEILIPYPSILPKKRIAVVEKDIEEKKRQYALQLFQKVKQIGREEAHYYLSLHDYDFREAIKEYNEDVQWEQEQREYKEKKKEKRKVKVNKWKEYKFVRKFLDTFGTCFPILTKYLDPYSDLELDRLPDDDVELKDVIFPIID